MAAQPDRGRRIVLLTEGHSEPLAGKTASCLLRYRAADIVAILDSTQAGRTAADLFGVGGGIPVVATLEAAGPADELLIGIAVPGGKVPSSWRPVILAAIGRGMRVVSGLHDFLADDPEFAAAARDRGVEIHDVRRNAERDVAKCPPLREECLRILTIGQDISVGKMVTSVELARALGSRGVDAKFIATGQTGIMIEGDGCPIDRVISDFVNGAVEKQVLANQHHEVVIVEGQATITHPQYSGVSLGLLHGCDPHGMVVVYEAGRPHHMGLPHIPLPPLERVISAYETMAGFRGGGRVIAVAMNSRRLSPEQADAERERVRRELGLPVADPIRHGSHELVDAVLALASRRRGA
ncbi:MAG: DUF1611 domain-containing protein [Planctomycetes bacterium]|nr:DUF1611 domain-containing protein [Planctomycetota bacterium]